MSIPGRHPCPTPAERARTIVGRASAGTIDGAPVTYVVDGADLLLSSGREGRASLTVDDVTLAGPCLRAPDGRWRLVVEEVRHDDADVAAEEWRSASPDPLAGAAAGIVEHMNDDHADALLAYCRAFSTATAAERAIMTAIDRYGFEMTAETPEGAVPVRLEFARPIRTSKEARDALVALVKEARARLAGG